MTKSIIKIVLGFLIWLFLMLALALLIYKGDKESATWFGASAALLGVFFFIIKIVDETLRLKRQSQLYSGAPIVHLKTRLPEKIRTVKEAEAFLTELYENNELYHPEDDAFDIIFDGINPDVMERMHLNSLMEDIYNLPEMKDYPNNKEWDACGFIIDELKLFE